MEPSPLRRRRYCHHLVIQRRANHLMQHLLGRVVDIHPPTQHVRRVHKDDLPPLPQHDVSITDPTSRRKPHHPMVHDVRPFLGRMLGVPIRKNRQPGAPVSPVSSPNSRRMACSWVSAPSKCPPSNPHWFGATGAYWSRSWSNTHPRASTMTIEVTRHEVVAQELGTPSRLPALQAQ